VNEFVVGKAGISSLEPDAQARATRYGRKLVIFSNFEVGPDGAPSRLRRLNCSIHLSGLAPPVHNRGE
jgi:hypothetical protein